VLTKKKKSQNEQQNQEDMGGDDPDFVAVIEFNTLLDALETAAQSSKAIEPPIFVVCEGIALKGKHGFDGINAVGQGAKEDIVSETLPGLISQSFGVGSVQGVCMGQALVSHLLYGGFLCLPAGADQCPKKQDLPVGMQREKPGTSLQMLGIKTVKEDVVFKNDHIFRPCFQSLTQAGQVRLVDALFDVKGVAFDEDEFNCSVQADSGELGRGCLSSVFALFQGDAVEAIEKIPTGKELFSDGLPAEEIPEKFPHGIPGHDPHVMGGAGEPGADKKNDA